MVLFRFCFIVSLFHHQDESSADFDPIEVVVSDRDTGIERNIFLTLGSGNEVYFALEEKSPVDETGTATYELTRTDIRFDYESEISYLVRLESDGMTLNYMSL